MKMNFPFNDNGFNYLSSSKNNQYFNNYTNNILKSSYDFKNAHNNNNFSNYEIRKLIKEEMESQIIPYRNEISKLKEEINNIYNNLNKDSIESLIKEIKLNLYNFVDKKYFNQKFEELDSKIEINTNNTNNPRDKINIIINEIKKLKIEINNIKNNNEVMKFSFQKSIIEKEPFGNLNNLNDIKLKDIMDKNSSLKTNFDNLKEEMDIFKKSISSSILDNNKNLDELVFKIEHLKLDDSSMKLNKLQDINKIKDDIKKLKYDINEMKIEIESNSFKSIDKNKDMKIYEILEKLNLTKLSNFDLDKYNMIYESYEKLMNNYINISKILEHHNNTLEKLNSKLEHVSFFSSKQAKKDIINFSDDNSIIQKKLEILERQIQYLQDRTERISLDAINIKESNNNYEKNKEEKLLMEQKINKLINQMSVYNAFIEDNNKKREELNIRIDEIKKDNKDNKDINMENKVNILQNQNSIKNNQQKLLELDNKNKILEEIIIKLEEEKFKKLENQIIRIEEKINSNLDEGKKLDEIKNEISENNKKNTNKKLEDLENKINNMKEEITKINTFGNRSNSEVLKIKNMEEQIKKMNENNNKILIPEEFEIRISNNSKNISNLEDRITKLEEQTNNIKKKIEEIKGKSEDNFEIQKINEIKKNNNKEIIESNKEQNKEKEELSLPEKNEIREEKEEIKPPKIYTDNFGIEVKNEDNNEDKDIDKFDDFDSETI